MKLKLAPQDLWALFGRCLGVDEALTRCLSAKPGVLLNFSRVISTQFWVSTCTDCMSWSINVRVAHYISTGSVLEVISAHAQI